MFIKLGYGGDKVKDSRFIYEIPNKYMFPYFWQRVYACYAAQKLPITRNISLYYLGMLGPENDTIKCRDYISREMKSKYNMEKFEEQFGPNIGPKFYPCVLRNFFAMYKELNH